MSAPERTGEALLDLDQLTRRLRRECPWDREQDERSIVPHTVEEAYELAEAAERGDDVKLRDELGDVLFQVHFLSLLLEERGAGDLAAVADGVRRKLIRRHPHVFGGGDATTAREVLAGWDAVKRTEPDREPGIFGELPDNLPGPLYARKIQRRAASAGRPAGPGDDAAASLDAVHRHAAALAFCEDREQRAAALGELLFAAVDVGRRLRVDPELALRAAADRFRAAVEAAGDPPGSQAGGGGEPGSPHRPRQRSPGDGMAVAPPTTGGPP